MEKVTANKNLELDKKNEKLISQMVKSNFGFFWQLKIIYLFYFFWKFQNELENKDATLESKVSDLSKRNKSMREKNEELDSEIVSRYSELYQSKVEKIDFFFSTESIARQKFGVDKQGFWFDFQRLWIWEEKWSISIKIGKVMSNLMYFFTLIIKFQL